VESTDSAALTAPLYANRNFILLWAGQFVSQMGDRLAAVAFPVLVYQNTHSALSTGAIFMIYTVPYLLFGTVAGVVIDRFNKRWLMIIADAARAGLLLCVPLVAGQSLPAVFVLAFLTASVGVFFDPCKLALLPDIVASDRLLRANSLLATGETITEIVGYATAGLLLASIQMNLAFRIDAVSFVVSAYALLFLAYTPTVRAAAHAAARTVGDEIREGLGYLWNHVGLRTNTLFVLVAALGAGASYPLTFLLAVRVLHGGAREFGIMEASIALGFFAGSLAVGVLGNRIKKGLAITTGLAVLGAALALVSAVSSLAVAVVPFFFTGIGNAVFLISVDTYFQQTVPEGLRGRVLGARFTLTQGLYAFSVLGGGALAGTSVGVRPLFIVAGVVVAAAGIGGLFVRDVRDVK
jgi:MFS family permease